MHTYLVATANAEPLKAVLHGDPLPPGAVARLGSTRWHVGTGASFLRFQPDGTILSHSDDFIGQVWDPKTGRELRHFDLRAALPGAPATKFEMYYAFSAGGHMAYSADGRRLALVTPDRRIHLLDATTGKHLKNLGTVELRYFDLGLSRDGGTLYLDDKDGKLTIRDTGTDDPPRVLRLPRAASFRASKSLLSPDEKMLLQLGLETDGKFADRAYLAIVWDLARGAELRRVTLAKGEDGFNIYPLIAPDQSLLAVPLKDVIRLVSLDDGKELGRISKPANAKLSYYLFAPDGKSLVGMDSSATVIMVWRLPDGKRLRRFDLPPAPESPGGSFMIGHAITPDGKSLAWCHDATIRVIDLDTGKRRDVPPGHTGPLRAALFTADGKEVITHGTDGLVLRWDPATGRELGRRAFDKKLPYTLQATADGKRLLVQYNGGPTGVRVVDADTLKEVQFVQAEPRTWPRWAAAPDSRHLAFGAERGDSVQLFDIASGRKLLSRYAKVFQKILEPEVLG